MVNVRHYNKCKLDKLDKGTKMSKQKILGFTIQIKGTNHYAVRRLNGRLYWITLGENLEGAERKILTYCEKKQLDLTKKPRITKAVLTEKVSQLEKMVIDLTDRVRQLEESNKSQKLDVRQNQTEPVRKLEAGHKVPEIVLTGLTTNLNVSDNLQFKAGDKILGFTISQHKRGDFRAVKTGGHYVHLGRNKSIEHAEGEIRKYLAKKSG